LIQWNWAKTAGNLHTIDIVLQFEMPPAATFTNLSRKFFGRDFSEIVPLLSIIGGTLAFGAYTWKNRTRDVHEPEKGSSGIKNIAKLGTPIIQIHPTENSREEKHRYSE